MCVCVCVYLGSISLLIHMSLNNIDIFCLPVFVFILSSRRFSFIGQLIFHD